MEGGDVRILYGEGNMRMEYGEDGDVGDAEVSMGSGSASTAMSPRLLKLPMIRLVTPTPPTLYLESRSSSVPTLPPIR